MVTVRDFFNINSGAPVIMAEDVRWVRISKGPHYELSDVPEELLDEPVTAIEPVDGRLLDIYVR